MEYKRFENDMVVRLDVGDDVNECLLKAAEAEGIALASVTGIGAADDFTVGVFDLKEKRYNEIRYTGDYEITAVTGNITTMNGKPYVHTHMQCAGASGQVVGGHLLKSRISLTGELFIRIYKGEADRKRNESLGINTIAL